jgi:hypothetical protein
MRLNRLGNGLGVGRGVGRHRRAGIAIVACLPLALLLGCGGGDEQPAPPDGAPPAPAAPVETPEPAPSAAKPANKVQVVTGEVPKNYPTDLPQPPSATAQTSMVLPGEAGLITFLSTESIQVVADHFKQGLPEQGWQIAETTDEPTGSIIKATKDTRSVDVSVKDSPKGDGTTVTVLLKEK